MDYGCERHAVEKEFSGWHRDGGIGARVHRAHRTGFLQVMRISKRCGRAKPPVSHDCDVHYWDPREQIRQRGYVHLHGPAGTCAIFNENGAATWRPSTRKIDADLLRASGIPGW